MYKKADWKGLRKALAAVDWNFVDKAESTDKAQEELIEKVLSLARKFIPVSTEPIRKSTHPWLNERCCMSYARNGPQKALMIFLPLSKLAAR